MNRTAAIDGLKVWDKKQKLVLRITKKTEPKEMFVGLVPPKKPIEMFSVTGIDESGEVQAAVWKRKGNPYDLLQVGSIVLVENPVIKPPTKYTRNKNVELAFNEGTVIHPIKNLLDGNEELAKTVAKIPKNFYSEPNRIKNLDNCQLNDVIDIFAYISDVGVVRTVKDSRTGDEIEMKIIELKDGEETVNLVLWRDLVNMINVSDFNIGTLVAIKGVKVGDFNGLQLQGIGKITEVVKNPDHPITAGMRKKTGMKRSKPAKSPHPTKRSNSEDNHSVDDDIEIVQG